MRQRDGCTRITRQRIDSPVTGSLNTMKAGFWLPLQQSPVRYPGILMTMRCHRLRTAALILLLLPICASRQAAAYSLLTHEQLIDLTWNDSIVPLLKSQYPNLTPAELDRARSFAYGGCVIQDMGYYPFGDSLFSDLTHYVRTGDFILALFRNAHNANELAFAAGALSHYVGDSIGHSEATNRAVALQFPKLAARYGASVNYAEAPAPACASRVCLRHRSDCEAPSWRRWNTCATLDSGFRRTSLRWLSTRRTGLPTILARARSTSSTRVSTSLQRGSSFRAWPTRSRS